MIGARQLTFGLALALVAAPSCAARVLEPTGQLVIYVDTDAVLPPAPGETITDKDLPALFDRVRIEILRPNETSRCSGCIHDFALDHATVNQRRASVGIVPVPGQTGYRARARLFLTKWTRGGEPNPDSTIDVTVQLPETHDEGITEVTIFLPTEKVGVPVGRESPAPAQVGPPEGRAGSWKPGKRVACHGEAHEGEVCVPGGAFWMGTQLPFEESYGQVATQQRIVVLSPFFAGTHEITVKEFRDSKVATAKDPVRHDANKSCTMVDTPSAYFDVRPTSCVSWPMARIFCQAQGGDLPTEAQYEYMAGGLASQRYVWGDDEPACEDAVFGQNTTSAGHKIVGACVYSDGLHSPGTGRRDRLRPPGAEEDIVDLAGNAFETTLDDWNDERGGPCWGLGIVTDPLCVIEGTDPAASGTKVLRGGNAINSAFQMRASRRSPASALSSGTSFRCVRADD